MQNLNLPLCPKCGNTKFVIDLSDSSLDPVYKCTQCKIEWGRNRILDSGVEYRFYSGSTTLVSPKEYYGHKPIFCARFPDGRVEYLFEEKVNENRN